MTGGQYRGPTGGTGGGGGSPKPVNSSSNSQPSPDVASSSYGGPRQGAARPTAPPSPTPPTPSPQGGGASTAGGGAAAKQAGSSNGTSSGSAGTSVRTATAAPDANSSRITTMADKWPALAILGGMALLAFFAPWVATREGVGLSLSGSVMLGALREDSGGSPIWGIAFAALCAVGAYLVLKATSLKDTREACVGASTLLFVAVIATWLGKGVWIPAGESAKSLHMAWGYWVALAAAGALSFGTSLAEE